MDIKLITASAGSGKTTKLVSTLVDLLKDNLPDSIVAITFTNAAAAEIKQRVGNRDLNVGTIHSFFAKILREQSIYINNSPNFKISDEVDAELVFSKLCKEYLLKNANNGKFYKLYVEFGFDGLVEIMQKLESRFYTISKNLKLTLEDFVKREETAEIERIEFLINKFKVVENFKLIESAAAKKDDDTLEKDRQYLSKPVSVILEKINKKLYKELVTIITELDFDKKPSNKGSKANWGDEILLKDMRFAISNFVDFKREIIEQKFFSDMTKIAADYEIKLMELFCEIHNIYTDYKIEKEILDFNDIEILIHDLVMNNEQICEQYRNKFKIILVDEFQDTNRLQKEVLQKLSHNLFLVGDAKQSIYRFRNADVSVFIETEKKYQEGSAVLSNNYRSASSIVDFVNNTFSEIFDNWVENKREFDAQHQQMSAKKENVSEGIVKIFNVGNDTVNIDAEARMSVKLILEGILKGRTAGDFAILFKTKKHMPVFERELKYAGIKCNLVDTDLELNRSIICLFKFLNNPYDDLSLFEILKYPKFFIEDTSIFLLKKEFSKLWSGISEYDVNANLFSLPVSDIESIIKLKLFLEKAFQMKDSVRFQVFVSYVLKESNFLETMSVRNDGDIGEIENMIFDAAVRVDDAGGGIFDFLEILKVARAEKKFNPNSDGVQLMSVHASKGLQFPVVIIPCLNQSKPMVESLVNNSEGLFSLKIRDENKMSKYNCTALYRTLKEYEFAAESSESKRLLYVAMTRAMDELYLMSNFKNCGELESVKNDSKWNKWIYHIHSDKIIDAEIEQTTQQCIKRTKNVRIQKTDLQVSKVDSYKPVQRYTVTELKELTEIALTDEDKKISSLERLGIIVHRALELYDPTNNYEFNKYISELGADVSSSVGNIVNNFVNSEIGKKIFTDKNILKVLKEESYLDRVDDKLIRGRIDRINVYKDRVWIIDFKTGISEEKDSLNGYKTQMDLYCSFASKLFSGKRVEGSIVDVVECNSKLHLIG